jgi:hypothetical protein
VAAIVFAVLIAAGTPGETRLEAAEGAPAVDQISLTFQSVAGGVVLGGSGTSAATLNFGTVSAFGATGAGVTRTVTAGSFTVSTPFGIRVQLDSGASPSYSLNAALAVSDATNLWTLGSYSLTTMPQTVATGQSYGLTISHTMSLTVPFSAPAGSINNAIEITAVAD